MRLYDASLGITSFAMVASDTRLPLLVSVGLTVSTTTGPGIPAVSLTLDTFDSAIIYIGI